MINDIKQDAEQRMGKTIDALHNELSKLRTGRAHPSLLEHIMVDYYGNPTPLSQVGNISVPDARTLVINPWEKNMVPLIEKAIMKSNLGLNPATSGDSIRIPMPALTEERRKDLIRILRQEAENARVAIRNIRRDANQMLKGFVKDKSITDDEERGGQDQVQKITDDFIAKVEKIMSVKEADLMEI